MFLLLFVFLLFLDPLLFSDSLVLLDLSSFLFFFLSKRRGEMERKNKISSPCLIQATVQPTYLSAYLGLAFAFCSSLLLLGLLLCFSSLTLLSLLFDLFFVALLFLRLTGAS